MAKIFLNEGDYEQWIDDQNLQWNCTCRHGSFGRWKEKGYAPCKHFWYAMFKLSWFKIRRIKYDKQNQIEGELPAVESERDLQPRQDET